jgi:hypothetical protein
MPSQSPVAPSVFGLEIGSRVFPRRGKGRGFRRNPMRVVAMRLMKGREFADGRVYIIRTLRVIAWIHIGFQRLKNRRGELQILRVDGLTADYHDLGVTRYLAGRADDMFELRTIQKWLDARRPSGCRRKGWIVGGGLLSRIVQPGIPLPVRHHRPGSAPVQPAPAMGPHCGTASAAHSRARSPTKQGRRGAFWQRADAKSGCARPGLYDCCVSVA